MPHRSDGSRRALVVLGVALMDGRHWQSAVQIVPTNRVIDEHEHQNLMPAKSQMLLMTTCGLIVVSPHFLSFIGLK